MAVSSVSNTSSALGTGGSAGTTASDGADRFLKLLVAQMQNQDPLNPMDNAQVTSQMAQINTVTGIEKLNTTVAGLNSQFVQLQALQGASLVGRDVIVPGKQIDVSDDTGQGGFVLDGPADLVKVEVLSPSGQVVKTIDLKSQSAGTHGFDFDAAGATNDSGLTFRVTATRGGASVGTTALMRDHIDAVSTSGTGFNLELTRSGSTGYDKVVAFN